MAEQLVRVWTKTPIAGLIDRRRGSSSGILRQFDERLGIWGFGVGGQRVADRVSLDAGERIWQLLRQSGPNSNVESAIREDFDLLIERVWW